jgi:hypothetical protein
MKHTLASRVPQIDADILVAKLGYFIDHIIVNADSLDVYTNDTTKDGVVTLNDLQICLPYVSADFYGH